MGSRTPEKQPVRLSIFNQTYSLLVSGDPADMERAAHEVDELMTTIAKAGNAYTRTCTTAGNGGCPTSGNW